ncbi:MAG: hypothetical protein JO053_12350 [Acidobacteria bacterium]|nr:hypothetical protein [Acidobacteriota bacterium]
MSRYASFFNLIVSAIFICLGALGTKAQMTIFNIPSSDTLQKSAAYFEADLTTKPVAYNKGGFQSYGFRVVYGLDNRTDAGLNLYYTRDGGDPVAELQFTVKRNLYRNERYDISASAGAIFALPVRDIRGAKSYAMVYANGSKGIKQLNGMRLTGGAYHIIGGGPGFGTKTGAMLAVEQPLAKRFTFIADWFSGRNRLGYVNAGVSFSITKRQYIMGGYSWGNHGRGNEALSIYYGYTF